LVEGVTPYIDQDTGEHLDLYIEEIEANENYMLPHLAAYTTSLARVKLVEAILYAGIENVVYGDTDSIFVNSEGAKKLDKLVGDTYGKIKMEKHIPYLLVIAPKLYFGAKSSAKGFPKYVINQ